MLLRRNPDNLDKNKASLTKNILFNNKSIIEKEDTDLNCNILKDKFDYKFLIN